jgi:Family of unknown function (DUF7019)
MACQREQTVYSRLRVVLQELYDREQVGSVELPGPYFRASMPMQWGPYAYTEGMVWFDGRQEDTAVGLGGRLANVLGVVVPESKRETAPSLMPYLLAVLSQDPELASESGSKAFHRFAADRDPAIVQRRAPHAIEASLLGPGAPVQDLEFVAKALVVGRAEGPVIHGSPLYVAAR